MRGQAQTVTHCHTVAAGLYKQEVRVTSNGLSKCHSSVTKSQQGKEHKAKTLKCTDQQQKYKTIPSFQTIFFFSFGTGDGIHDFALARQVLAPLS